MKDRKWLKILTIAIIVLAVVWFFFFRGSTKIEMAEAVIGKVQPSVNVPGEIRGQEIKLGTKMPLVVSRVDAKEGDSVGKGKLLLKFDNYESAKNDYERIKALYDSGFASKQQVEVARLNFESSRIISPIDGIVTLIANKVGETAAPGSAVIIVVDPKTAYAELQVDEADVGDVTPGKEVSLSSDAYPDLEIKGKLVRVSQAAEIKKTAGYVRPDEEDKIFRAKVTFDNSEMKFKIGMSVNGDVVLKRKENVLIIPREAVFEKDGKKAVFLINKGKAKEAIIETGLKDFMNVEITKGLKEKDKVAITEIDKLKNGARVSEVK